MSYSPEEKIKWFAIISRIAVLVLQFLFNVAIPDHDAGVFRKPTDPNATDTVLDRFTRHALGGLSSWDSQYFLHIAEYGYTYENTLAFFPLFPLVTRRFSYVLHYLLNTAVGYVLGGKDAISVGSCLMISAAIINNVIFVKTTLVLYRLSLVVLKDEKLSYASAVLFCVNPASIFFSAAYSESLYCFSIFYGLLQMEMKNFFLTSIVIGLSGLIRSNGIINIGFLFYSYLRCKINKRYSCLDDVLFSVCIVISVLPFGFYQLYCYLKYCFHGNASLPHFIHAYGIRNGFKFPGSNSSWCGYSVPFAYSYVQSHYWNVGLLRYYQLKQVPNFLLALPVLLVVFLGCYRYLRLHRTHLLHLGLKDNPQGSSFPISTFVYVSHCLALSVFAALVIHVQVTTRLLFSSSPVPYWFSAWFVSDGIGEPIEGFVMKRFTKKAKREFIESHDNRKSRWRTFLFTEEFRGLAVWIKYYFLGYLVAGTLMFSNHLPWT